VTILWKPIKELELKLVSFIPSDFLASHVYFLRRHRRIGDFRHPRSYSEFLQHKNLYKRTEILAKIMDKWEVRKYVEETVGTQVLAKIYQVCDSPDDLAFSSLPNSFVLKMNHGCGWNIFVRDKTLLDRRMTLRLLGKWFSENYYYRFREWGYKNIAPRLLVEEYLQNEGQGDLPDFKFFCFHGKAVLVQVDTERHIAHKRNLYTTSWKELSVELEQMPNRHVPRPRNLNEMIRTAEALTRDFDFCRVDLYDLGGRVVFGEMTPCPAAGLERFRPVEFDFFLYSIINKTHPPTIPLRYWKENQSVLT